MSRNQEPNSHIAGKFLETTSSYFSKLFIPFDALKYGHLDGCGYRNQRVRPMRGCDTGFYHLLPNFQRYLWLLSLHYGGLSSINELLVTIPSSNGFTVLADLSGSSACLQTRVALDINPCICTQISLVNDRRVRRTGLHASIRYHPAHDLV